MPSYGSAGLPAPTCLTHGTAEVGSSWSGRVNRRYFLVIVDSQGRSLRRLSVARRSLQIWAATAAGLLVLAVAMLIHGIVESYSAREAARIARENASIKAIAASLEKRIPELRSLSTRADMTFGQLWAKSGLGTEPRALAVGPLEKATDLADITGDDIQSTLAKSAGSVLSVEPEALGLEIDRVEQDGRHLQRSLGEMLEYFRDAARLLSNTPSVMPVVGGHITSPFGKRKHPIFGGWVMHKGLDIGGYIGLEIFAPADGEVIFTGVRGGYGRTVVIDHGYGLQTHYAHLSRILATKGERVRRGDVIAEMGSSGSSTGPHLHYEVRRAGQPLNPLRFILD